MKRPYSGILPNDVQYIVGRLLALIFNIKGTLQHLKNRVSKNYYSISLKPFRNLFKKMFKI